MLKLNSSYLPEMAKRMREEQRNGLGKDIKTGGG